MCGRYAFGVGRPDAEAMVAALRIIRDDPGILSDYQRYNITPTQIAPVVRAQKGERGLHLLEWGFQPKWAKSALINAKAETVAEKNTFKKSLRVRRCVVPASGYYEWQSTPGGKQPWYIHDRDKAPLLFAGLVDSDDRFVIITRAAAAEAARIHSRMPALLGGPFVDLWLDEEITEPQPLLDALCAPVGENLTAHEVSKDVNKPINDSPELIEPV